MNEELTTTAERIRLLIAGAVLALCAAVPAMACSAAKTQRIAVASADVAICVLAHLGEPTVQILTACPGADEALIAAIFAEQRKLSSCPRYDGGPGL